MLSKDPGNMQMFFMIQDTARISNAFFHNIMETIPRPKWHETQIRNILIGKSLKVSELYF